MKIKTKLLLAFAIVMVVFVVTGAGILLAVSNMNTMNTTVNTQVAINEQANNLERAQMNKQRGIYMYVRGNTEFALGLIEESKEIIEGAQETLNELLEDPELIELLNGDLEDLEEGVGAVIAEMMETADSNDPDKMTKLEQRFSDLDGGITLLNQRIGEFRAVTDENVAVASVAAQEYGMQVFQITAAGIAIAVASSTAIALLIGHRISSALKQLSEAARKTSLGKFKGQKLKNTYSDEIKELSEAFNRMLNSFKLMDAMNKGNLGDETNEPRTAVH
jgi:CHASE3 domain sensor protein